MNGQLTKSCEQERENKTKFANISERLHVIVSEVVMNQITKNNICPIFVQYIINTTS